MLLRNLRSRAKPVIKSLESDNASEYVTNHVQSRTLWRCGTFLKFKASRERQAPSEKRDASSFKGIVYSWANISLPLSIGVPVSNNSRSTYNIPPQIASSGSPVVSPSVSSVTFNGDYLKPDRLCATKLNIYHVLLTKRKNELIFLEGNSGNSVFYLEEVLAAGHRTGIGGENRPSGLIHYAVVG